MVSLCPVHDLGLPGVSGQIGFVDVWDFLSLLEVSHRGGTNWSAIVRASALGWCMVCLCPMHVLGFARGTGTNCFRLLNSCCCSYCCSYCCHFCCHCIVVIIVVIVITGATIVVTIVVVTSGAINVVILFVTCVWDPLEPAAPQQ